MGAAADRGWTLPLATDLVRNLPAQLTVLADQIAAATAYKGAAAGNTDASGYATVNHGLAFTPSKVFVQSKQNNPVSNAQVAIQVDTIGAASFRVRFLNLNADSSEAGEYNIQPSNALPYSIDWLAFR